MILDQINKEKKAFEIEYIKIVDGFDFNQKETIERIYRYYNSKFLGGEIDAEGDKKYFFNINRNPCKVTTKAIDFDTKHINILTAEGSNPLKTWFFERDLKFWMKDQNFGKVLNRIFAELPIFGSVVIKVINKKPYFVDLRNFIVDQAADTLGQANYIIEQHLYTPIEFRKVGEELGWENIEEVINLHRQMNQPYIKVYERYGEVEMTDEEGNKTYDYKRVFIADVGMNQADERGNTIPYPGITLKEENIDTHPYWEFHMEKIAGRWLGMGVVEILFDAQVRQNEIANLQAKGSYFNALRLFQTRDETINRNLMTEAKMGEVLNPEDPITQIDMGDRNLAYFNQETLKWMKNVDDLTFRYEVTTGERLPAGTPLGSARLAAAMTAAYFEQIRENVALDIKEFLFNIIIPKFQNENSKKHTLRLIGEDLDKYNNLIIEEMAELEKIRYILTKNEIPTQKYFDILKASISEKIKQGKEKSINIPSNFYEDIKYKIDIIITGEEKDIAAMTQVYFAALQAITADPTILIDPQKKKLFYKALENSGINPIDIEPIVEAPSLEKLTQIMPVPKGAGGGISRPASMATPTLGTEETRI